MKQMTMSNILVSLSSVPKRFGNTLPIVLRELDKQSLRCDFLLCIPQAYRKWGAVEEADIGPLPNHITLYRPSEDFGPATKLLGALEYANGRGYDAIITVDDDVVFSNPKYLEYLAGFHDVSKDVCWTVGGIKLSSWPYHNRFGLQYDRRFQQVDAVRGVTGTVYPADKLLASSLPFQLRKELPDGVFHDDDAYFGSVLHQLNVPLFAIPMMPGNVVKELDGSNESAVAEKAELPRTLNESRIFRYMAKKNLIGHGHFRGKMPRDLRDAVEEYVASFLD